jgi:hypothetical protein
MNDQRVARIDPGQHRCPDLPYAWPSPSFKEPSDDRTKITVAGSDVGGIGAMTTAIFDRAVGATDPVLDTDMKSPDNNPA